ncbi:nucleotide sugar dehydrogenase [Anaerosalibacter bizertensis]|uniref:Nucleotide sugar dehydrogenase n=1 Tax=Anaerosalibacter bizertensis TaxID=932217 RepID=A0A9Q4AAV8_9FIRM|nr:nucleotide sugar dehydrogenase [Anaerosalibacter bizertensis]MBV1817557.1 nucleotide sugar dehydrogenase [Bacteroidales bacterium MSK.15.36]MCB5558753.1 nucleotide sugar dehydrogenase [Anaerosalibacter bizertensis]MCG4564089.1 nucleotide sugar dehydrogenase [Anaerosalibacter bizertensis]MCG4582332.1 nucleotide sugar dehydrogenase [Anaerosalibacter bizertensis]MCG4583953.1 nucleotide sugar dehydrogenase [Anaerosalibacter bizertensis]
MKITVIGLGYIGLPTAVMFAKNGVDVVGYDVNKKVLTALNQGEIIIEEPGLKELVKEVVNNKKLRGVNEIGESDVFIVSVPTPINEDKTANMKYVKQATESVSKHIKKGDIFVLESTSPPGTIEEIILPILSKTGLNIGEDIFVAYSPERVLPGRVIQELVENDRLIGGVNEKSAQKVKEVYSVFVKGNIYLTDSKTAEMCKLMENTYRDVNIALANELAITCEEMGINAWEVIELSNKHPRVNIHQPGPGVGGHCLAVDPWFIVEKQKEGEIIRMSREINDDMPIHVLKTLKNILKNKKAKIAILGISYKPNIDDMRESPIIKLIDMILEKTNYRLSIHDPYVSKFNTKIEDIMVDSVEEAVEGADIMVLGVNHDKYRDLDFDKIADLMNVKHIYDTRNFLDQQMLEKLGFEVTLLGRG